jgi:hypothetical protein
MSNLAPAAERASPLCLLARWLNAFGRDFAGQLTPECPCVPRLSKKYLLIMLQCSGGLLPTAPRQSKKACALASTLALPKDAS